jgi:hypothetical protein
MKTYTTQRQRGMLRSFFVLLFLIGTFLPLTAQESLERLVLNGEGIESLDELSDFQKKFYQQVNKRWSTLEYETLEYVKNEAEFLFQVECFKEELSIVSVVIPTTEFGMLTVIVEWDEYAGITTFYVDFKDWEIVNYDVE